MATAQTTGGQSGSVVEDVGDVQLDVYDVTGRLVASVFHGRLGPGTASLEWGRTTAKGSPAEPGVYFAKLQAFGRTQFARLTLLER